jgi:hypothetical protein
VRALWKFHRRNATAFSGHACSQKELLLQRGFARASFKGFLTGTFALNLAQKNFLYCTKVLELTISASGHTFLVNATESKNPAGKARHKLCAGNFPQR